MKTIKFLFSPLFMGVIMVVLAIAMAVATFTENNPGASAAPSLIYSSHWFELLFLILVINLAGQIIVYKLYRREKITVMLFHVAFIVMIAGAAITRYSGFDGTMHIREGRTTSVVFSSADYIVFDILGENDRILSHHAKPFFFTPDAGDKYRKTMSVNEKEVKLSFIGYRNTVKDIEESEDGQPVVSFVVTRDMIDTETLVVSEGESTTAYGLKIGFSVDADLTITLKDSIFYISSPSGLKATNMKDMESETIASDTHFPLSGGIVYDVGDHKVVLGNKTLKGVVTDRPVKEGEVGSEAFEFAVSGNGFEKRIFIPYDPTKKNSSWKGTIDDINIMVTCGSKADTIPFSIKLNDFKLERYPGSHSPSEYRSMVTLTDRKENSEINYDIYMNHILKYKGYRFYQSSYDNDERGTVLSVNHDSAGMITTYTGYALLFLFIILSIFNRKSFFRTVGPGYWNSGLRRTSVLLLLLFASAAGNTVSAQKLVLDKNAADDFGEVLAQDFKGRTKPLNTISSDFLRKVSGENKFEGLSPMQVFMGYSLDFANWQRVPLIKVSNNELRNLLGLKEEKAAFTDLADLNPGGTYKLASFVDQAYAKPANERNRFDKEVIKLDERLNICYMVSKGDFLRLYPVKDGTDAWGSAKVAANHTTDSDESAYIQSLVPLWAQFVASEKNSSESAEKYRLAIIKYQSDNSTYKIPSLTRVKAEIFYYKTGIFEKLFPFYLALGLLMIMTLVGGIISGKNVKSYFLKILTGLIITGFVIHTMGLGIRWYISGHSPMSNGYESMLFVSWVTLLAGIIFSRKSLLTLSATCVLSGMTLMVAHLSFMDPEITNLVPVLKSYWLTLHVSVITGSYGFLGLGAMLGFIVLIMMLLVNNTNRQRISDAIDDLTVINYKALTLGLYFLTIGTFLGAIWANESWGRYWGWDPKETWSLITIIVYALVTHSRMIPGMKDVFAFNLLSLFAFSSVLMTYFGVNYYLSGMHSYAGGDIASVPGIVYITILLFATMVVAVYLRYKRT